MQRFLEEVAAATGASRLELRLTADGAADERWYGLGGVVEGGHEVVLELAGPFHGRLRVDSSATPPETVTRLATLALEQILLALRQERQATMLRRALDRTSNGVLVFSTAGDIVYANPPADRLLSRQTEDGLVVEEDRGASRPLIGVLCAQADGIARSESHRASWKGTMGLSDGSALTCEILKLETPGGDGEAFVLAVLHTGEAGDGMDVTAISSRYSLTPREREVIQLLLQGHSTPAIAERMGISQHTVRDHLKRLYRKTQTTCRDELFDNLVRSSFLPR